MIEVIKGKFANVITKTKYSVFTKILDIVKTIKIAYEFLSYSYAITKFFNDLYVKY